MSNLMFKRKLISLNYPENVDAFDINNDRCFKSLVGWLEDQKIRHYKIEDRKPLRDWNASNWNDHYVQYLNDISCPFSANDHVLVADWCLTFALRLEFEDNLNVYKEELANKLTAGSSKKTNPLDSLNFETDEFRAGVKQLAKHLKIPLHPDDITTLKAILVYVRNRLEESDQCPNDEKRKSSIFKLEEIPSGCNCEIKEVGDAVKLMRLLYINNLRDLQTSINQILVNVQSITADPKTDTTLGRVGR